MFQNVNQNLGSVQVGSKHTIKYPFSNIVSIDEVKTACTCTIDDTDRVNNVLTLEYRAKEIPNHLIAQGWYTTCIKTTVKYKDTDAPTLEKTIILTFTVTVKSDIWT